jgi:alanyl-tRNA synthetase
MTDEELTQVEDFVNARIEGHLALEEKRNIPMQEALATGAMALFGEKYGDTVRTIRFGQSVELCGGTHVKNTGDIWHFKIKSEGAVAAGIRRIEAITSDAVKDYFFTNNKSLDDIKEVLGNAQDPVKAVSGLQQENNELKKQIAQLLKEKAKNLKGDLAQELHDVNGVQFLAKQLDLDAAGIKDLSFEMGQNTENLFLLFASEQEGKALLSCYISKELVASKNLDAGTIVRELGKYIQGGGGGQPFFATAGGKNPAGIAEALEKAKAYVAP